MTDTKPMTKMKRMKAPKTAMAAKPRSAISMACSADADAKNLKGKPRKTFRKSCMADKAKMEKTGTMKKM